MAYNVSIEQGKTLADAKGDVFRGQGGCSALRSAQTATGSMTVPKATCLIMMWCVEVVEFACNIASEMKGEFVEHVSTGMDTYSLRQPMGVRLSQRLFVEHSFSCLLVSYVQLANAAACLEQAP